MAITSVGYNGTVNEIQSAAFMPLQGTLPCVVGDACAATVVAGSIRTVRLTGGVLVGHGIVDTSDTTTDLTFAESTAGRRWDTVVVRRDWTPVDGGTTTLTVVQGGASAVASVGYSDPGVQCDTPLWLVPVDAGQTTIDGTSLVDLRAQSSSIYSARDIRALGSPPLGTVARVGGIEYARVVGSSGTVEWAARDTAPTLATIKPTISLPSGALGGIIGAFVASQWCEYTVDRGRVYADYGAVAADSWFGDGMYIFSLPPGLSFRSTIPTYGAVGTGGAQKFASSGIAPMVALKVSANTFGLWHTMDPYNWLGSAGPRNIGWAVGGGFHAEINAKVATAPGWKGIA